MSGRPRVLLLTNSLVVGGAETQFTHLALHLHGAGYPVLIATILPDGEDRPELAAAGIPHEVLPLRSPVRGVTAVGGAVRLLRRWKPDVLISFLFYANVLGRLAAAVAPVPVVVSSVRTERFGGWMSDLAFRFTNPLASLIVTNSRVTARRLVRDRIVRKDRIRVIPNGVPLGDFAGSHDRETIRRALGVSAEEFLWLAVGRLEAVKDYPTLLRATATLRNSGLAFAVRIAADGSQRAPLEALADDLHVSDIARFLGLRHDVPALLDASDALVLASLWEGLPNVVIEAMATGVPVVATNRGGTTELIEPGITGFLVPPRDERALADAMEHLMRLPVAVRRGMGEAGRRFVSERFALDRVMGLWEQLIAELTGSRSSQTLDLRTMSDASTVVRGGPVAPMHTAGRKYERP